MSTLQHSVRGVSPDKVPAQPHTIRYEDGALLEVRQVGPQMLVIMSQGDTVVSEALTRNQSRSEVRTAKLCVLEAMRVFAQTHPEIRWPQRVVAHHR